MPVWSPRALTHRALLLMVLVGVGWGLLWGPVPSQGQFEDLCPQEGCPKKPEHDPPQGEWVLVIIHVGEGRVMPPCDPDKKPIQGAKVSFTDTQEKPLEPGSQKPDDGLTDAKGRYAAYLALPGADWNHIKEVQVTKAGFQLAGVVGKAVLKAPFVMTALKATACMQAQPGNLASLDLRIWPGPGVQPPGEPPLPDTIRKEEEKIGSWTCVNLDNDNRNGLFDLNDMNVINKDEDNLDKDEDDLVKLVIEKPGGAPNNAQVQLQATKNGNKIKIWDSPTKGNEIKLPAKFGVNNLPKTLWVEGVAGSKERDVELELVPVAPFNATPDKVTLTVIAVEKMTWIGQGNSVQNDNNLDANAHPGPNGTVGKRVFPDAPGPRQPARDRVTLEVTLSALVPAKFKLYLRALDVDDPSSDSPALDPNDDRNANPGTYPNTTIGYTLHEDNRGSTVLKSGRFVNPANRPDVQVPAQALTDPQGVQYLPATLIFQTNTNNNKVDFQVTHQPGDNFRVLASCDPKFLDDAVNQDNQGHGLEIRIATATAGAAPLTLLAEHNSWQGEVLTVWRRLHLEVDSMAAPGNANTVSGQITNVAAGPGADQSTVTTNQNLADQDQYECPQGRYPDPCRLNTSGRNYNTRSNSSGPNAKLTVNLRDTQNNLQPVPTANQAFTLHDDDQDDVLPQPVAAPGAFGANAWLAWLQDSDQSAVNLFADAYVRPALDGGGKTGNNQPALPFRANVEIGEIASQINTGKQVTGSEDYWVSYVQASFQDGVDHDNDPDGDFGFIPLIGFVGTIFGVTPAPGDASLLFVESYRDGCGGLDAAAKRSGLQATVVHEVGHTFGAGENEGGVMNQGCLKPQNNFSEVTLNRIRSSRGPGRGTF